MSLYSLVVQWTVNKEKPVVLHNDCGDQASNSSLSMNVLGMNRTRHSHPTLQGCCKARIRWGGNPWALWKAMLKEHWSFPACLRPEFWYKRGSSFLLDLGLHYSPPDLRKNNMCTWFQQQERSLCQYAWDFFISVRQGGGLHSIQ